MYDYIFNYTYYNTYTRVMNLYDVSQGLSYLWVLHACVYPVWQRENLTIVCQRLRQGMLLARCQDRTTCEFQGNVHGGTNSWLGFVLCPSQKMGTLQMISPSPLVRNPVVPFKSAKVIATSVRCH
jgi:hypothetical protein